MIRHVAQMLARRLLLSGLLVTAVVFLVGAGYTGRQPTSFTATAVLAFAPRAEATVSADMAMLLAEGYRSYLTSAPVAVQVATEIGASPAAVDAGRTVAVMPGTANVEIDVKLATPEQAAAAANALANAAAKRAEGDPNVRAEIVWVAAPDAVETNPPRQLLLALAALVAVIAGVATSVVLAYRGGARSANRSS